MPDQQVEQEVEYPTQKIGDKTATVCVGIYSDGLYQALGYDCGQYAMPILVETIHDFISVAGRRRIEKPSLSSRAGAPWYVGCIDRNLVK